jgi:hypothetical protein
MWKDKMHKVDVFVSMALQANVAQSSIFQVPESYFLDVW